MDCSKAEKVLWAFTPSRSNPEDLESILVQRHHLLADAVERIRESVLTDNKHHLLFVGPRGSGKSFIVTVVVNRLCADKNLKDRLRIAWLNEDETCTTFLEFLARIFEALVKRYPDEYKAEILERAYEISAEDAPGYLSAQLASILASRTIVVVTENLDALFDGLKEQGQMQLRAFLQESGQFALFATAQRLVGDITDRDKPFFGFFQTEHLKPLSLMEATELLGNIARLRGDAELVRLLSTSRGLARVRTLHHLSGGNHRIYIVLSNFITHDNLDDILLPFLKMVDDLTPYYQERIRWLPPLQRKIVEYLCTCEETVPVKEIAKRLFSSPQSISGQLQELREKGYVSSNQRGRESLYEISEPLMRICVEVKENHGQQPLRLLVNFLRAWYDDGELNQRLGTTGPSSASCAYLKAAIERNQAEGSLRKRILLRDIERSLSERMQASEIEDILKEIREKSEDVLSAYNFWAEGDAEKGVECLRKAMDEEQSLSKKQAFGMELILLHLRMEQPLRVIDDCSTIIAILDTADKAYSAVRYVRAIAYGNIGDFASAIKDLTVAISHPRAPVEQTAQAFLFRGIAFEYIGEIQHAIEDYTAVIGHVGASSEQVAEALVDRGGAYKKTGEIQRGIEDYTTVVELAGAPVAQVARARIERGDAFGKTGETQRGIKDYTAVVELSGVPVEAIGKALMLRCLAYVRTGATQRAIEDSTMAISLSGIPAVLVSSAYLGRATAYLIEDKAQRAIEDFSAFLSHPGTHVSLLPAAYFGRASSYALTGDVQRAVEDFTAIITIPGVRVEPVVDSYRCLAEIHFGKGRWSEGYASLEAGLARGSDAKPCYFGDASDVVKTLFEAGLNPARRSECVKRLFDLYVRFNALSALGDAVIKHIGKVFLAGAPFPASDNLDGWLLVWQEAAQGNEDAKLFLRLLRIGIEFLKSGGKDAGILLTLTTPERRILEQAFGIEEEGKQK